MEAPRDRIDIVLEHLRDIKATLDGLVQERQIKDWYTTEEVASLLEKAPFTVREWCRMGRVSAEKRSCGRGYSQEWVISHDELTRIRNRGLLPVGNCSDSR